MDSFIFNSATAYDISDYCATLDKLKDDLIQRRKKRDKEDKGSSAASPNQETDVLQEVSRSIDDFIGSAAEMRKHLQDVWKDYVSLGKRRKINISMQKFEKGLADVSNIQDFGIWLEHLQKQLLPVVKEIKNLFLGEVVLEEETVPSREDFGQTLPEATKMVVLPVPLERISGLGGKNPILVQEKILTVTDVKSHHNRFPIYGEEFSEFLTEEEKEKIKTSDGLVVPILDPEMKQLRIITVRSWGDQQLCPEVSVERYCRFVQIEGRRSCATVGISRKRRAPSRYGSS